ncbi:glutamine synthetase beta-grasp domain-containing protein [Deltaproteobacteria bacterium]|nr:glutamine synthetase beta-grasp domain-containing protein [Deltaproteobacteria bacterium]
MEEIAPEAVKLSDFPDWSFDGSSTNQAPGDSSDCILKPVFVVRDPVRKNGAHYLVMCEVWNADDTPHESNTRAKLRDVIGVPWKADAAEGSVEAEKLDCWFGLEQEYTLFKGTRPLGFPDQGYPSPQGPYYCGVGADEVHGRPLVEDHMFACARAGLKISGVNAEVMPGQWEFQIGPAGPLEVGDHLWIARWLLYRLGEDHGINASLDAKPVRGDWNGAGMHTNFSTPLMRKKGTAEMFASGRPWGVEAIEAWCAVAGEHISGHLDAYGDGYQSRLTGAHETASYKDFSFGVSDRTASVRIPLQTDRDGYGYLEDRRPNANADPYEVAVVMLKSAYNQW